MDPRPVSVRLWEKPRRFYIGVFLRRKRPNPMITLGIETSCDETACGLVDENLRVLAHTLYSQVDMHALYGGVVPEIAARAHLEKIAPLAGEVFRAAGIQPRDVDLIAYTRGPGLLGPLLVGASFARGLALRLEKPLAGINHLEGHLGTAYLADPMLKPPFLCLVVSGGHTEFCRVNADFEYLSVGRTRDDAAGEAFDKCGKIMGLGYPAGPEVAKWAEKGDSEFVQFPRALDQRDNLEFSFSGLKSSVLRYCQEQGEEEVRHHLADICASLQAAIVDILVKKSMNALKHQGLETLVVVGGVSANSHLQKSMEIASSRRGFRCLFPPKAFCGDNGAMIAAIAQIRHNSGQLPLSGIVTPGLRFGT